MCERERGEKIEQTTLRANHKTLQTCLMTRETSELGIVTGDMYIIVDYDTFIIILANTKYSEFLPPPPPQKKIIIRRFPYLCDKMYVK